MWLLIKSNLVAAIVVVIVKFVLYKIFAPEKDAEKIGFFWGTIFFIMWIYYYGVFSGQI